MIERDEGEIILEDARHPALETLDNMCFIANDAHFDKKSRTFCIITGPNLGGKSTYLRTVALSKNINFLSIIVLYRYKIFGKGSVKS